MEKSAFVNKNDADWIKYECLKLAKASFKLKEKLWHSEAKK